jgi:hypothetical protein
MSLRGSTSCPSPPLTTMVCSRHTAALCENLAHGQVTWDECVRCSTSLQLMLMSDVCTVHTSRSPNTCTSTVMKAHKITSMPAYDTTKGYWQCGG